MAAKSHPGFEKNLGLMDYKRPPRRMIDSAKAERNRRKACHGNHYSCETAGCEAAS